MTMRFGYSSQEWNDAKEEMRAILIERAKRRGDITYSDLANHIKAIQLEAHSHAFRFMLGEVASEEDDVGRGLITVIVVYKGGDSTPGSGFFDLARKRGYDVSNEMEFWIQELNKVHEYWAARSSS